MAVFSYPILSMYGIFIYIYHKNPPFMYVGKDTSPMDGMGYVTSRCVLQVHRCNEMLLKTYAHNRSFVWSDIDVYMSKW